MDSPGLIWLHWVSLGLTWPRLVSLELNWTHMFPTGKRETPASPKGKRETGRRKFEARSDSTSRARARTHEPKPKSISRLDSPPNLRSCSLTMCKGLRGGQVSGGALGAGYSRCQQCQGTLRRLTPDSDRSEGSPTRDISSLHAMG